MATSLSAEDRASVVTDGAVVTVMPGATTKVDVNIFARQGRNATGLSFTLAVFLLTDSTTSKIARSATRRGAQLPR
jgi:hypothetical protein